MINNSSMSRSNGFVCFMPGRTPGRTPERCGCHGVSLHASTNAGTLVLGLINAGTLTGTNAYDFCVREHWCGVAHFSGIAICVPVIKTLTCVVVFCILLLCVYSGRTPMQFN